MRFQIGALVAATALAFSPGAHSGNGTIGIAWDPVAGATGYRVYYGTESGQYGGILDVGNSTDVVVNGLDDCTTYYASVKAYNAQGESASFSNEVSGWARPMFDSSPAVVMQGTQLVLQVTGANFASGANLTIDENAVPLSSDGDPLIIFDSVAVVDCDRIEALVTVEPMARGFQAMPIGNLPIDIQLQNPDGVYNTGLVQLDVLFNPDRADVNRAHPRTVDRVDGDDLAAMARSWAAVEGQETFEFDCDLDGDTDIDGDDLALLATYFGHCRAGSTWTVEACL
jgi:hypothetical protein